MRCKKMNRTFSRSAFSAPIKVYHPQLSFRCALDDSEAPQMNQWKENLTNVNKWTETLKYKFFLIQLKIACCEDKYFLYPIRSKTSINRRSERLIQKLCGDCRNIQWPSPPSEDGNRELKTICITCCSSPQTQLRKTKNQNFCTFDLGCTGCFKCWWYVCT